MAQELVNPKYRELHTNIDSSRKRFECARADVDAAETKVCVAKSKKHEVAEQGQRDVETAKAKAKDLATLGHPFYHQTKQLDQEEVIKKINSGIEKITVSAIMPK